MASTIGVRKIFDGITIAASGATTSEPVEMGTALALALFVDSIAGTALDVTFTYSLGNTRDGAYVTPTAPVTIGANIAAADVLDFAPELAKYIRIIATNNNGANPVTEMTCTLIVQENG
jgi:hypothetical protein